MAEKDHIKDVLRECIMRANLTFPENEQDEKWFNEGFDMKKGHGADLFLEIHKILDLGNWEKNLKK